jgi:hypothetical protein
MWQADLFLFSVAHNAVAKCAVTTVKRLKIAVGGFFPHPSCLACLPLDGALIAALFMGRGIRELGILSKLRNAKTWLLQVSLAEPSILKASPRPYSCRAENLVLPLTPHSHMGVILDCVYPE